MQCLFSLPRSAAAAAAAGAGVASRSASNVWMHSARLSRQAGTWSGRRGNNVFMSRTMPTVKASYAAFVAAPSAAAARRAITTVGRTAARNASAMTGARFVQLSLLRAGSRRLSTGAAPAGGLLATYMRLLETNPILTKSITSALIALLGDVVCQVFFESTPFSLRRCFNMTFLGLVMVGPGLHFWFGKLATWIPGTTTVAVVKRLALDQLLWAPFFVANFFVAMSLLQGNSAEVLPDLPSNLWAAMLVNWKLWPACQAVNFMFVPVHLQVLVANLVALVWNGYLSYATSRLDAKSQAAATAAEAADTVVVEAVEDDNKSA